MGERDFEERTGRELLWNDKALGRLLAWRRVKARCEADDGAFNGLLLEDLRAGGKALSCVSMHEELVQRSVRSRAGAEDTRIKSTSPPDETPEKPSK